MRPFGWLIERTGLYVEPDYTGCANMVQKQTKKFGNKDAVDLSSDGCEGNMDSQKPPLSKSARWFTESVSDCLHTYGCHRDRCHSSGLPFQGCQVEEAF